MDVEKVSVAVEIEGKPYFVALDQTRMKLLIQFASGLSDNGKLNVVKAPSDYKFTTLGEL